MRTDKEIDSPLFVLSAHFTFVYAREQDMAHLVLVAPIPNMDVLHVKAGKMDQQIKNINNL